MRTSEIGKRWQLDFVLDLRKIIATNIQEIFRYSTGRNKNTGLKVSLPFNHELQTLKIHLLLNSDGVNAFKSNSRSLWPVWLAVADLPPVKRCMYKNITLATLWYGKNKPDWNELFQVLCYKNAFQFSF